MKEKMSHNACSVQLSGGHMVFIRLVVSEGDHTSEWHFFATDGKHCFNSSTFTSSTLVINGILDFIHVIKGLFFVSKCMTPFESLIELFSDVVYEQGVA